MTPGQRTFRFDPVVGFAQDPSARYPAAPFDPPALYPEFRGTWLAGRTIDPANRVYALVREALFRSLGGFDERTGDIELDTLRSLGPFDEIFVKPNWVRHEEPLRHCTVTHASVLRPILDYLRLAFGAGPKIMVGDIPIQSADLDLVWTQSGTDALQSYCANTGLDIDFRDLRRERLVIAENGYVRAREPLPGDPRGYREVHLGTESFLEPICREGTVFSVSDYEPGQASCFHRPGVHAYLLSQSALDAGLFVNVPKLKTHCKAGLTLCMKNLVGLNGEKGWIPHFRRGSPRNGGDEYPDDVATMVEFKARVRSLLRGRGELAYGIARRVWRGMRKTVETARGARLTDGGAWPGNDTVWRSVLDLAVLIHRARPDGVLAGAPVRQVLNVVDAVIAGERNGPLAAQPTPLGAVLAGVDMFVLDGAVCRSLGIDEARVALICNVARARKAAGVSQPVSPDPFRGGPGTAAPALRLLLPDLWRSHLGQ